MIVIINWNIFHLKFFNQNAIYVQENENDWTLYTQDSFIIVKCIVKKSENSEENIMFVQRYLDSSQNIIKVEDINEGIEIINKIEPSEQVSDLDSHGGIDESGEL